MFSHSLMGLSHHPLLGLYLEQGLNWSGCFLKFSLGKADTTWQSDMNISRGCGYATNIDRDIHPRLTVLLTLTVQWLTQWFTQWPHWTMARLFRNEKVRDDTYMVGENKMLMAITRIHPHSWRFWTDWSLDQDRGRLFGIFDWHPHSSHECPVQCVRIILIWFFFRIYLFMSLETKEFFSNESFGISF